MASRDFSTSKSSKLGFASRVDPRPDPGNTMSQLADGGMMMDEDGNVDEEMTGDLSPLSGTEVDTQQFGVLAHTIGAARGSLKTNFCTIMAACGASEFMRLQVLQTIETKYAILRDAAKTRKKWCEAAQDALKDEETGEPLRGADGQVLEHPDATEFGNYYRALEKIVKRDKARYANICMSNFDAMLKELETYQFKNFSAVTTCVSFSGHHQLNYHQHNCERLSLASASHRHTSPPPNRLQIRSATRQERA